MTVISRWTGTTGSPAALAPATEVRSEWASAGRVVSITVATFAGPWLIWGSRIAQAHGLISWHLPMGLALWSIWPLLTVAILVTGGRAALSDLWSRLLRWRIPGRCYVLALLTPPLVAAATVGLATLLGVPVDLGASLGLRGAAVYLGYGIGLFLLTEEAAWRGAILPRLQTRVSPMTASLLLGAVWTAWHIPSLHVPGESDQGLSLPVFAVLVVSTTILITTLVNAASGSVIIAALFHASFDAAYAYTGVVGGDPGLLAIAATLTVVAAVAVGVATRGRLAALPSASPLHGRDAQP
jgi:membrane protease YdiL (CAAX protease family)